MKSRSSDWPAPMPILPVCDHMPFFAFLVRLQRKKAVYMIGSRSRNRECVTRRGKTTASPREVDFAQVCADRLAVRNFQQPKVRIGSFYDGELRQKHDPLKHARLARSVRADEDGEAAIE